MALADRRLRHLSQFSKRASSLISKLRPPPRRPLRLQRLSPIPTTHDARHVLARSEGLPELVLPVLLAALLRCISRALRSATGRARRLADLVWLARDPVLSYITHPHFC